jgi:Pyruvate/2-oxoacid:ferredoxin oxidoreductase delta subunit
VCPTGAIRPLPLPEKKAVRIGLAVFDTGRCLPYAFGRNCIVCEEHCPIPTKAITFTEVSVRLRDGSSVVVKQPRVDADLCTGCGICENVCPFRDRAAVRVTSANESRHPGNRPFLTRAEGGGSL